MLISSRKNLFMPSRIVFFDGICNLCNGFVDFLITADKNKVLFYASLQGTTALKQLPKEDTKELNSIVFLQEDKLYYKSDAVLRIISQLGFKYKLLTVFLILPSSLRNLIYDFIAKRRYLFFGKRNTCRIPSPEEKTRFLD